MKLFVYGTLQPGQRNWPLIASAISAQLDASVRGFKLWDLHQQGYPAITHGAHEVFGQLLCVIPGQEAHVLSTLDDLEGYDPSSPARSLYWREPCVAYAQEQAHQAWIYRYNPSREDALIERGTPLSQGRWPRAPE